VSLSVILSINPSTTSLYILSLHDALPILTNSSTIQGSGNIGEGQMTLVNSTSGIIDASNGAGSSALTIQTSGGTTNTGILEATRSEKHTPELQSLRHLTNTRRPKKTKGSG